jgi:hypothetical protein
MEHKQKHGLQIKVYIALALLLLGSSAIVYYLNLLAQDNHANQELMSYVRQVEVQGQAIKRRATHYSANAPRDYPPYNRDVIIFYPNFIQDIEEFDQQLMKLQQYANRLPQGFLYSSKTDILKSINKLQSNWREFKLGLQQQLGDNPNEPRLEWGADYVQENQALLNDIADMLTTSIDMAIQKQLQTNRDLSLMAMAGAGGLLLLGVIWFYFRVIRRITLTVNGCQRVAQGDFGYQLPLRGNDELTSLAKAFNTLSARTLFVLNMLSKMHRHGNVESKLDSLWQEAGGYLPIQWLGLWQYNIKEQSLEMMGMRSNRTIRGTVQDDLINAARRDTHLLGLLNRGKPIKYDDLIKASDKIPTSRLFREIIKLGLLNSALLVPLRSDDNWQGILIFIDGDKSAYTREQLELMGNLAPFMANGYAQDSKAGAIPAE